MEFIVTQRRGWLMQGSGSNFVQGVELLLLELGRREKKKRHHTLCRPRAACLGWQTHQDEPTGFSADRRIL